MHSRFFHFNLILIYILIICLLGLPRLVSLRTLSIRGIFKRSGIDILYEENDEITVEIAPEEQDRKLLEAQANCSIPTASTKKKIKECEVVWDSILCWPRSPPDKTVTLPCPYYINKFNTKKHAIKHCKINLTTNIPEWTKTNFSLCLLPSEDTIEDVEETKIIETHLPFINAIRISGYVISLISLFLSIAILLRPKLRCPRNFIHINLFFAFVLRTILIMVVGLLRKSPIFEINLDNSTNDTEFSSSVDNDPKFIPCRFLWSFFRYSGSVYHVSIFSEAIYLVMLLKFPYYSEVKGCKFCIVGSWTLPFLWFTPWVFIRIFIESKWCWQIQSEWNLFIEGPHTVLLIINVMSTIFIIRVLYSKIISGKLSREKLMKYRRLAKSTLVLIPIFGLHFIFFAWLPYARIANDEEFLPIVYIEAFFNAFQGLVVSIACCFIQREVQIEVLVIFIHFLKYFKCFRALECIDYLENQFIPSLRFKDKRSSSNSSTKSKRVEVGPSHSLRRSSTNILLEFDYKTNDYKKITRNLNNHHSIVSDELKRSKNERSKSTDSKSSDIVRKICCCLLDSKKNDFYQSQRHFSVKNEKKQSKSKVKKKIIDKDQAEETLLRSSNQNHEKLILNSKQKHFMIKDLEKTSGKQNRRLKSLDTLAKSQLINAPQSQNLKKNKRNSI